MPVRYSGHAKYKLRLLRELGVDERLVEDALRHPDQTYYDTLIGSRIVIKELQPERALVVAFRRPTNGEHVITVYYTTKLNTVRRAKLVSGRWVRLGQH